MSRTGGRPRPSWNPSPSAVERLRMSTTQAWASDDVTDLGIGQPDLSLLPSDMLQAAFALEPVSSRHPLQYGHPFGDGGFRLALGEFLTGAHGVPTDPEQLFVTNGNSQAIDLVCSVFTRPGDVVFVEDPTYFLALDIFRRHGLNVVGVAVDEAGMSIDALEAALVEHRPVLVYTIPAFQNPTGVTLSAERRTRLVELARHHEFLVVADEVYQLLSFDGSWVAPLAAHVDSGVVLSLGTFSKILAPGLRLGWIQSSNELVARLGDAPVVASGAGLNPFASAVVRVVLEEGWLEPHVSWLCSVLRARSEALGQALAEYFPESAEYRVPTGGYFYWVRLPGEDPSRWRDAAIERKVGYRLGAVSSVSGGFHDHLRLSFAYYEAERIEPAIAALGAAIRI